MGGEFDLHTNAQYHQAELLSEATARRLIRMERPSREAPVPARRRLQTLLRRIAGATAFA